MRERDRGRRGRWRRGPREIQLIPFMDVLLVLLVAFMVGAPIAVQGIDLQLPSTEGGDLGVQEGRQPVVISIDQGGDWHLDAASGARAVRSLETPGGLRVAAQEQLPHRASEQRRRMLAHLELLYERDPSLQVLVRGHALAPYEAVARLLAELQLLGLRGVSLVTLPSGANAGS